MFKKNEIGLMDAIYLSLKTKSYWLLTVTWWLWVKEEWVLRVVLDFGSARLVWHSSRRKKWDWWRWARKVGSNGSGSWQKDMSQNIVKGQVFLGWGATVHWHFHKKDCRTTIRDREREKVGDRSGEWECVIINCHWGNLWCKITSVTDLPRDLQTLFLI